MNYRRRLNKPLLTLSSAIVLAIGASQPAHALDVKGFISGIQGSIEQIQGIFNGDGI
ncbi:MAG: hypothetical protein F6K35_51500, partial [Okeania sp. SIO2H7]|nr:hypothetical protein [Okeania sp. SIO2H7]